MKKRKTKSPEVRLVGKLKRARTIKDVIIVVLITAFIAKCIYPGLSIPLTKSLSIDGGWILILLFAIGTAGIVFTDIKINKFEHELSFYLKDVPKKKRKFCLFGIRPYRSIKFR